MNYKPIMWKHYNEFPLAQILMKEAMELIGKKSSDLNLTLIVVTDKEKPMTFYPFRNQYEIDIHLTQNVIDSGEINVFQLSHEILHTLVADKTNATNLEEGLCTYFSIISLEKHMGNDAAIRFSTQTVLKDYTRAFDLVKKIIEWDEKYITRLRERHPLLKRMEYKDLIELKDIISTDDIEYLLSDFNTSNHTYDR